MHPSDWTSGLRGSEIPCKSLSRDVTNHAPAHGSRYQPLETPGGRLGKTRPVSARQALPAGHTSDTIDLVLFASLKAAHASRGRPGRARRTYRRPGGPQMSSKACGHRVHGRFFRGFLDAGSWPIARWPESSPSLADPAQRNEAEPLRLSLPASRRQHGHARLRARRRGGDPRPPPPHRPVGPNPRHPGRGPDRAHADGFDLDLSFAGHRLQRTGARAATRLPCPALPCQRLPAGSGRRSSPGIQQSARGHGPRRAQVLRLPHRVAGRRAGGHPRPGDVVVIKINYQWDQRRRHQHRSSAGLIRAIVDHPDGFTGEVVVCENAQSTRSTASTGP